MAPESKNDGQDEAAPADPGAEHRRILGIADEGDEVDVAAGAGTNHPTETGIGRHIPPVDDKSADAAPHGEKGESGFKGDAEKGAAKS